MSQATRTVDPTRPIGGSIRPCFRCRPFTVSGMRRGTPYSARACRNLIVLCRKRWLSKSRPGFSFARKPTTFSIAPADLVQTGSPIEHPVIEDTIRQRLAEERARLESEAGVVKRATHHFKKPVEKAFTADQRPNTTLLFGGLTWKHEKLVHGAL